MKFNIDALFYIIVHNNEQVYIYTYKPNKFSPISFLINDMTKLKLSLRAYYEI